MIQIGFEDSSILMEAGDLPDAVPAAVRSACQKLNVEFWAVASIQVGEMAYSDLQIQEVCRILALQDALAVIEQYADSANWSGVFNRQKTVRRRWKGAGESGNDLAFTALDRLQQYDPSYRRAR